MADILEEIVAHKRIEMEQRKRCLLYTSDAADE